MLLWTLIWKVFVDTCLHFSCLYTKGWKCWARNCQTIFKASVPFYVSTSNVWGFLFLLILISTYYCLLFYSKYFSGYLLSHCTFDLIFLMTSVVEHIFTCCYITSLGKCPFKVFDHFLVELCIFFVIVLWFLHITDIRLLPDIQFANIFPPSMCWLFTFLTRSFESQKFPF